VFLAKLTKLRIIISKRTRIIHRETKRKKKGFEQKSYQPNAKEKLFRQVIRICWRQRCEREAVDASVRGYYGLVFFFFFYFSTVRRRPSLGRKNKKKNKSKNVCVCVYWEKRASEPTNNGKKKMKRETTKGDSNRRWKMARKKKRSSSTHMLKKKVIFLYVDKSGCYAPLQAEMLNAKRKRRLEPTIL
jgi:hypothetical protein